MSFELPDGTIARTLPEQVAKNAVDIEELKTGYNQIASVAIVSGILHVYLEDGTDLEAGSIKDISSVDLDDSKHLIVTYTDGTTSDLGLFKSVSGFSIDASQHLIVTYNNGTTEDLGAIFTGDINIAGTINATNVTGDNIVENMTGYSFNIASDDAYQTKTYHYVGAVKNGNKLTIAIYLTFNMLQAVAARSRTFTIGTLYIPSTVGAKIYPATQGSFTDVIASFSPTMQLASADYTFKSGCVLIRKSSNTNFGIYFYNNEDVEASESYNVRIEVTFLLSDSLVS